VKSIAAAGLLAATVAVAEERPRLELQLTTWASEGRTALSTDFSAFDARLGDPTSELSYRGLDALTLELGADLRLPLRLVLRGRIGVAGVTDGELIDDDFVTDAGAEFFDTRRSGAHLYSRTKSEVGADDAKFRDLELRRELLPRSWTRSSLAVLAGYRRWEERYVARGVLQVRCTAPGILCNAAGTRSFFDRDVIENEASWDSVWLGVDGERRVSRRVAIGGRVALGDGEIENDDVHLLRSDLAQDPSFFSSGDGEAFELEARVGVRLTELVDLRVGYRRWELDAEGRTAVFAAAGGRAVGLLDRFESDREGLTASLALRLGRGRATP
jgi:hypothetical protein